MQPVDQQTERHPPADGDDEIDGPVDEGAGEGEEPDNGQEDAETGYDLGVYEPPLIPRRGVADGVEVVACEAGHDRGEGQFREAEDHRYDVDKDHFGGLGGVFYGVGVWFARGIMVQSFGGEVQRMVFDNRIQLPEENENTGLRARTATCRYLFSSRESFYVDAHRASSSTEFCVPCL